MIEQADLATQLQQDRAGRWYRIGRSEGYAGVPLAVPLRLRELPELIEAYSRGHQRGQDEREVDEAQAAWRKLPWDDGEPPERED